MTNVFMILCDELRADAFGYMGNEIVKTPHIDALAEDSVIFENSYCNTPMCVPSRVSIATGRHALSHGAVDNMVSPQPNEISFYSLLQDKGYHTVNHGKWHSNIEPEKFGFDSSNEAVHETPVPEKYVTCFGVTDAETRRNCEYKRNYGDIPLIIHGTRPSDKDDTLDSIVTKNYLNNLEEIAEADVPIFARLSIMDPHTPYFPSEPYASMYNPNELPLPKNNDVDLETKPILQRYFHKTRGFDLLDEEDYRKCKASYFGLVSHVDDRVGMVIDKLKALNLYEDSLIIFLADHGTMLGEQGFVEKWGHMYEPVMRTPLLVKLPKNAEAGKRLNDFVESIDIMPTILDVCGYSTPSTVQGKSLMPYITGKSESHKKEVYGQYYCGSLQNESALMVRDAKWKLTSYPEGNKLEDRILMDHPLAMSEFFEKTEVLGELYDMENDPDEMNNLFNDPEYEDIKVLYMQKLVEWVKGLQPIVNTHTSHGKNRMGSFILLQGENMRKAEEMLRSDGLSMPLERKIR